MILRFLLRGSFRNVFLVGNIKNLRRVGEAISDKDAIKDERN